MNRNTLYLVIGLLVVAIAVGAYLYYQQSQTGIDIEIGDHGVSIQGN